jgi:hypothetical protein
MQALIHIDQQKSRFSCCSDMFDAICVHDSCLEIKAERSRMRFFHEHRYPGTSWKTVWQWVALSLLAFFF